MPRGGRRPGAGAPADNLNADLGPDVILDLATRGGARRTIAKVLDAALLHMAGLVKRRRRKAP